MTDGGVLDRIVEIDGLNLRFRSSGPSQDEVGNRPPFVLIHGIGMSHRSQSALHEHLAINNIVHSVDLPGFGDGTRPDRDVSIKEMARTLAGAFDRLAIREAVIVGHSMGAQWVIELAVQRPDLFSGVAVIGPVADDRRRHALAQMAGLTIDTFLEPPRANLLVVVDYLRSGPVWYLRQVRHMLTYPIDQRAALVRVPLLVLRGGRDFIAGRSWCQRLRNAAPEAYLVTVPAGAHNVQLTAAKAVASAIRAFSRGGLEGSQST